MEAEDITLLALTAWRENRGGGTAGMQSIINVVRNRAWKRDTTPYEECVRPLQFSSLTAKGDPELSLWPNSTDLQWQTAKALAEQAAAGALEDLTRGATLYYNPAGIVSRSKFAVPGGAVVAWPEGWDQSKVRYVGTIARHLFFVEL